MGRRYLLDDCCIYLSDSRLMMYDPPGLNGSANAMGDAKTLSVDSLRLVDHTPMSRSMRSNENDAVVLAKISINLHGPAS
jgi:hypothetical protein